MSNELNYLSSLEKENRMYRKEIQELHINIETIENNLKDYKLRIDKAIEIISKEFLCYDNESDEYIQGKKAINILNGVSDIVSIKDILKGE